MDPHTIVLETAFEVYNIPVSGGSFPSLPAVELLQDTGTWAGTWARAGLSLAG